MTENQGRALLEAIGIPPDLPVERVDIQFTADRPPIATVTMWVPSIVDGYFKSRKFKLVPDD